jgi:hypothetical protein
MLATNEIIQICSPAIYPDTNEPVCGICGEDILRYKQLDLPLAQAWQCYNGHMSYDNVEANICFVGGKLLQFEGKFINTLF